MEIYFIFMSHILIVVISVSGVKSDNPLSPAYIPNLFQYTKSPQKRRVENSLHKFNQRQALTKKKKETEEKNAAALALLELSQTAEDHTDTQEICVGDLIDKTDTDKSTVKTVSTQTDFTGNDLDNLHAECRNLRKEKIDLLARLERTTDVFAYFFFMLN